MTTPPDHDQNRQNNVVPHHTMIQNLVCREILLRVLGISGILIFSACSPGNEPNAVTGSREQILHIGNGTEPQDLDPHIVTGVPEHRVVYALLEGLVDKNPRDLAPEPAVARSWSVSNNHTRYTFHLRDNAKWSNGDRVTARDFVYSWNRVLLPRLGSQYAYMLFPIKNAERFYKREISDFAAVGVTAPDDHTLVVELERPTPYFLQLLSLPVYFPVHRKTIEKFGAVDERGTRWTRAGNFVGNGAFRLKEWILNRIITVEKNPYYWDAANVRLNRINFYPVDNITTEERMFRAGQLHITEGIPTQKIAVYKSEHPDLIRNVPYLGTYYYSINVTRPPLNDVRVRRALAMTINREQLIADVTKGGQLPAYTFTPPDTNGYTAPALIKYDIDAARDLLAQAGYPNGDDFPSLTLTYNTSEGHRQIATAVQQMWKTALNIDITLENQDWKVFLDNQRTMNYRISRASWIGDYLDPNTFLDMFVTAGGNNRTGWSNPRYDKMITAAANTTDQKRRYSLFQKAERILMNEVPVIPIYTYTRTYLVSPDVKGWYSNILDYHPYKYVYLSPPGGKSGGNPD